MLSKYEKVQELLQAAEQMAEEGYTQKQIAEKLGLGGKRVVKELLRRERKRNCKAYANSVGERRPRRCRSASMRTST